METFTHLRQTLGVKIVVALFFLLIPFISNTQTQVFPEKDAIWCIKTDYQPQMLLYGLTGDTIIQEKQYSKLYLLNDTTLNIDEGDEYIAAIRIEDKKVWMYPLMCNIDEEFLLYDFSKNKGEKCGIKFFVRVDPTIEFHVYNKKDSTIKILDITEDKFKRKHYIIENAYEEISEWIEGVGSLKGLFYYSLDYPVGLSYNSDSHELVSLKQGNSIVYHNKDVCKEPFCWFGVGLEDTQQTPSITLYPNPVKETLHIDLGETPLPIRFDLFDTQGHIIHTKTLTNPHTTVTPPPHSKGLHHYRLTGSDGKALQSGQLLLE